MLEIDAFVSALGFVLLLAGIVFIYYLSKMSQYNEASELRAKRRIEDVAYYLSKMEEQIEDCEAQLNKKIDANEVDTRINLTAYEKKIERVLPHKSTKRRERVARP